MKISRAQLLALLLLLGWVGVADAQIKLARSPGRGADMGAMVLARIYKMAGVDVQFITMPPNRASVEADAGHVDGESARIMDYAASHPALLRVEPAYTYVAMGAFYLQASGVEVAGPADLQKYSLGYVKGLKVFDDLTEGNADVHLPPSRESLFKMLKARRFAVALDTLSSGQAEIRKQGHAGVAEVEISRQNLYHYLNVRHAALAGRIGAITRKLADSGQLARMMAEADKELTANGLPP